MNLMINEVSNLILLNINNIMKRKGSELDTSFFLTGTSNYNK